MSKYKDTIEAYVNTLEDDNYKKVINSILDEAFYNASGSGRDCHHHYGGEGLSKHSCEVMAYACAINTQSNYMFGNKAIKREMIVAAALFHDIGKTLDYGLQMDLDGQLKWAKREHCRKIGHISAGYRIWMEKSAGLIAEEERVEIAHAILAHHGAREYGSPIAPATSLAWLIHCCDMMSARLDEAEKGLDRFKI